MHGSPNIETIRLHGASTIKSIKNRPKGSGRDQSEDAEADRIHGRVGMRDVKLHEMIRNNN